MKFEARSYTLACQPRDRVRPLTVTILDIDFTHDGVPALPPVALAQDEGKGRGTDMTYVYSPGRGLVHLDGNE